MEEAFRLQPNNPLTVEAIQNILSQKVSVKYSPEITHSPHEVNANAAAANTITNDLVAFAIGLGSEVPADINRVMLLLLADYFARNPHPESSHIVLRILEFYEFEIIPQVFSQGLYASPTAHLLLPVFGAGKVYFQNYLLNSADVHDIFSWQILSWPNNLPTTLIQASFLGIGSLVYNFVQFKNLFEYAQLLFPELAKVAGNGKLYPDQIKHLENQLNEALAFPQTQQKHLSGLTFQLEKLLAKFGEHISELISDTILKNAETIALNQNILLKADHLLALMQTFSEENLILYEGGFDTNSGPSADFTNQLQLQPYQILKNLEQIIAIATILRLTDVLGLEKNLNLGENLKEAYRNQVIDVLKDAIFADLIRKTILFMYASVPDK